MKRISGGWIVVLTTTSNPEEAKSIAKKLLEKKLVACVNIIEKIHSLYWWKDEIREDQEALLIIKTRIEKLGNVIRTIKEKHSYEVPEIIALPILAGSPEYLQWLDKTVVKE
jgi:periplasmic divalent cation tolerance protein